MYTCPDNVNAKGGEHLVTNNVWNLRAGKISQLRKRIDKRKRDSTFRW